jgi:uncharacterized protein (DUF2267 family)
MNEAVNEIFSKTLDKTHIWLTDLMQELEWKDEHKAYLALRAVLHTLRDRLTVEEAADLAAQLPMLVRGFYFEGWHPAGTPLKERHKKEFLAHVQGYFKNDPSVVPEKVVRAVFKLLRRNIARGEVNDIGHILPGEVRALWA